MIISAKAPDSFARANLTVAFDLDFQAPQRAVAPDVGRRVAEEILIGQLLEQVRKRTAQLLGFLGHQRAAAAGGRTSRFMTFLSGSIFVPRPWPIM